MRQLAFAHRKQLISNSSLQVTNLSSAADGRDPAVLTSTVRATLQSCNYMGKCLYQNGEAEEYFLWGLLGQKKGAMSTRSTGWTT